MITVSKDGNGDFASITEALKNAVPGNKIFIKNGIYYERPEVTTDNITILGENPDTTIIEYDNYALMPHPDGKLGTFRSYTFLVNADNFICRNITIANTAGFGKDVGQAVAVYAEGDNILFENCRILGHQDTLFTGPLPYKEIEKGGFRGPTQFSARVPVKQIYRNCYIKGEVDFIFGSAAVLFDNCELFSVDCGKEINGYVTAASTYENMECGYVFLNCRFTGNCTDSTVYIGRPWRNFAKTVLINCEIGTHIRKELFHDWNKHDSHNTVLYGVYNCHGKSICTDDFPPFVKVISKEKVDFYISYFN